VAADREPDPKAIQNERVKLTAGFVDRMAGAFFAVESSHRPPPPCSG